ncbi:MAG: hypothetical protein IT431_18110 [Phycisphaerales bacterium]|nr:hypothetical protein [Phycisphaerales bacterium]
MSQNTLWMVGAVGASACAAFAQIDGVQVRERIYNDFPNSTLVVTNNFPAEVTFDESSFGSGGWANRHAAYFSADGGATANDFDYGDAFDFQVTLDLDATPADGREAGFHADLFGLGFFGVLPNGEIAAFGSILPFHSFGSGVWTPGDPIDLRIIHTPGDGDGTSGNFTVASTFEYMYNLGGGWVSSGAVDMTTTEGGIPSNFDFLVGVGVQNQGGPGGSSVAKFTNIIVPAPASAALLALSGVVGLRRRR